METKCRQSFLAISYASLLRVIGSFLLFRRFMGILSQSMRGNTAGTNVSTCELLAGYPGNLRRDQHLCEAGVDSTTTDAPRTGK